MWMCESIANAPTINTVHMQAVILLVHLEKEIVEMMT